MGGTWKGETREGGERSWGGRNLEGSKEKLGEVKLEPAGTGGGGRGWRKETGELGSESRGGNVEKGIEMRRKGERKGQRLGGRKGRTDWR